MMMRSEPELRPARHPVVALSKAETTAVESERLWHRWTAALFLLALLVLAFGLVLPWAKSAAPPSEPSVGADATEVPLLKPIEEVQVGERIAPVTNPGEPFDDSLGKEVDPATWRRVDLRMAKDGGTVEAVLLRPHWWLDERLDATGSRLELSIPELDVEATADVISIGPCPPIAAGEGPVVTGTFCHVSYESVELHLHGLDEAVRCTPDHPVWSHDRREYVGASDLRLRERVEAHAGTREVEQIVRRTGPLQVYNMEIHGEHVYRVTESGILVHNAHVVACRAGAPPKTADQIRVEQQRARRAARREHQSREINGQNQSGEASRRKKSGAKHWD